jgi:hypothetical protein
MPANRIAAPKVVRVFGLGIELRLAFCAVALLLSAPVVRAQDAAKTPAIATHARLMAARTIYIEHAGGRLPNDVIGDAFQGWGHYQLVGDPARADLIVAINAPTTETGISVGPGSGNGPQTPLGSSGGQVLQIRLFILDARDRVTLWSGIEQPKGSRKEKQREDNVVDSSLHLFRRFRDTIEPALPDQPLAPKN